MSTAHLNAFALSSLSYRRKRRTVMNLFHRFAAELQYVIEPEQKISRKFIEKVFAEYGHYQETGKIITMTRSQVVAYALSHK